MTSPRARKAIAEGTMKKAMRRSPASSRRRRWVATSASEPERLDIAGSSAADTDIPNRLPGIR